MSTFVNNDVSSGAVVYASDHNTQGALIAAVLNGGIDNNNISASAAIDGTKLASSTVTASKVNFGGSGSGIWWEEIGRTTLSVAGDSISVTGLANRKYLRVIISTLSTGGTTNVYIRFNNDSGTNYTAYATENGTGGTATSQNAVQVAGVTVQQDATGQVDIVNIATSEKTLWFTATRPGLSGGSNSINFRQGGGKWANSTDAISRIDILNIGGTGDYAIGSEIIILGHN